MSMAFFKILIQIYHSAQAYVLFCKFDSKLFAKSDPIWDKFTYNLSPAQMYMSKSWRGGTFSERQIETST